MFVGIANNIYANKILGDTSSAAILALLGESDGLAIEFDDDFYESARGLYGSIAVKDTTTPSNNIATTPYELLFYSSPSVKYCRGPDGNLRYGAHNLYLHSEDASQWSNKTNVTAGNTVVGASGAILTKIEETSASGEHVTGYSSTFAIVSGLSYRISVDLRSAERIYGGIRTNATSSVAGS